MKQLPPFNANASDRIDTVQVPVRTLYTGSEMPAIGLGTFGNDRYGPDNVAEAVHGAIEVGYRLIDCAAAYRNEKEIGFAIQSALRGGVKREELFITSKLWNDKHAPADVIPALEQSLSDLQVDYLDAYYIHWPFANTHAPGAGPDDRHPDSRPYNHKGYMATYHELEKAVDQNLIRHIGTSNMTIPKLDRVLADAIIPPALNQMEMHPAFPQPDLFIYLFDKGMVPVAYSPLGSPERPERDTTIDDVSVLDNPLIRRVAEKRNVHPAIICLKWAVQRGQVPIPSSVKRDEFAANIKAVCSDPLDEIEMRIVGGVDSNCRLIKGQVFLWEGAESWRDLWDVDGTITGVEE